MAKKKRNKKLKKNRITKCISIAPSLAKEIEGFSPSGLKDLSFSVKIAMICRLGLAAHSYRPHELQNFSEDGKPM